MAYNALDVARYIQIYLQRQNKGISNLKMQKILYYIQAGFLVETKDVCFDDEIICWRHGPAIRSVYNTFRKFISSDIPNQSHYVAVVFENGKFKIKDVEFDENIILHDAKMRICKIVDALCDIDAWDLVEYTHEESPWKDKEEYNTEITPEEIRRYFIQNNHRGRIYGQFA